MRKMTWLQVRMSEAEKRLWQKTAEAYGMSLSDWVRACCEVELGLRDRVLQEGRVLQGKSV